MNTGLLSRVCLHLLAFFACTFVNLHLNVYAGSFDLLPGDPAFLYEDGWVTPTRWNADGTANITNLPRIGTRSSGFHLTFQGARLAIYGSENMTFEAWINGRPIELEEPSNATVPFSTKLYGTPLKSISLDSDTGTYQLYLRVNGNTPATSAVGTPDYFWFGGVRVSTDLPAAEPAFWGVNSTSPGHDILGTTNLMGFGQGSKDATYNISEGWNWMRDSYVTRDSSTIWSGEVGSKMEIVFNGTGFWLFGTIAPYTSVANISIDWTERTVLNMTQTSLSNPIYGGLIWAKTELIPGTHCVRIQILDGRVNLNFVRLKGHPVDPDIFYSSFTNSTRGPRPTADTLVRHSWGLDLWQILLMALLPSLFIAVLVFIFYRWKVKKLKPKNEEASDVGILDDQKSSSTSAPIPTLLRNTAGRGDLPMMSNTPGVVVPYDVNFATDSMESPNGSGNVGPPRRKGGFGHFSPSSPVDRDDSSLTYPDSIDIDDRSEVRPYEYSPPLLHLDMTNLDEAVQSGFQGSDQTNSITNPTRDDMARPSLPQLQQLRHHLNLNLNDSPTYSQSPAHRTYTYEPNWAAPPPSYPGLALSRNGSLIFSVRNDDGVEEPRRYSLEKHVAGMNMNMNVGTSAGVGSSSSPQLQLSRADLTRLVNRIAQLRGRRTGGGPGSGSGSGSGSGTGTGSAEGSGSGAPSPTPSQAQSPSHGHGYGYGGDNGENEGRVEVDQVEALARQLVEMEVSLGDNRETTETTDGNDGNRNGDQERDRDRNGDQNARLQDTG